VTGPVTTVVQGVVWGGLDWPNEHRIFRGRIFEWEDFRKWMLENYLCYYM